MHPERSVYLYLELVVGGDPTEYANLFKDGLIRGVCLGYQPNGTAHTWSSIKTQLQLLDEVMNLLRNDFFSKKDVRMIVNAQNIPQGEIETLIVPDFVEKWSIDTMFTLPFKAGWIESIRNIKRKKYGFEVTQTEDAFLYSQIRDAKDDMLVVLDGNPQAKTVLEKIMGYESPLGVIFPTSQNRLNELIELFGANEKSASRGLAFIAVTKTIFDGFRFFN